MAGRMLEILAAKVLDASFGDLEIRLEGAGEDGRGVVDAGNLEHQGDGLHAVVFLSAEDELRAGARGDIAVARGVDHDLRAPGAAAVLAFCDDAADLALAVHERSGDPGVEADVGMGLVEHFEKDELELVWVDEVLGGAVLLGAGTRFAVEDFAVERAACAAGPVAHVAGGGDAAHGVGLVYEQDLRAKASRRDCGGNAGRTCAGDDDVVRPRYRG